jgi:hypothetical protein
LIAPVFLASMIDEINEKEMIAAPSGEAKA